MTTQLEENSCCAELYSAGFNLISAEPVNHVHFNVSIHFVRTFEWLL